MCGTVSRRPILSAGEKAAGQGPGMRMKLDQRCAEHVGTLDDANSSFVCQLQIVVELCCKILFAEKGMVDRREGYPRTARIRLAEQKRRLLSRFISGQEMRPELAMQGAGEFQGVHALHPLRHSCALSC